MVLIEWSQTFLQKGVFSFSMDDGDSTKDNKPPLYYMLE